MTAVLWLRRDLRRDDHPALGAAADEGRVAVLFVLDPAIYDGAGPVRQAWLARTLRACAEVYEGRLCIRRGDPRDVVPAFAAEVGATSVHVSRETEPGGQQRDQAVAERLAGAGVALVATGSPYAVTPGRVLTSAGAGFAVFSPFARAWRAHGWPPPAAPRKHLTLLDVPTDPTAWAVLDEAAERPGLPDLPEAGEDAAKMRWRRFLADHLDGYTDGRDRPDLDATSRLSPYLKFGVLHPRTLLADLAGVQGRGAERYLTELAWREFYADVLRHNPHSAWADLHPALSVLRYDTNADLVQRWREGRTGYPIVDAGMRQLLREGWMHNRVRMITASFLCKDLHVWWPIGARHFLDHLADGDLASNSHNWQWVAGTGTDPAPYFRVFSPVRQGRGFDPQGDYVRRHVEELRHIGGADVHEPWTVLDGYAHGYPEPIVDHAAERKEALGRYSEARPPSGTPS